MDRKGIVAALEHGNDAARECSASLLAGSEFAVFSDTVAAGDLVWTYRRRAEHVSHVGLDHGGFDDAVAALDAYQPSEIRLAQVSDTRAKRHYQLFLAAETDDVVGCLWVHHDY